MKDTGHLRLVNDETRQVVLVYRLHNIHISTIALYTIRMGAMEAAKEFNVKLAGEYRVQALFLDGTKFIWRDWTGSVCKFNL